MKKLILWLALITISNAATAQQVARKVVVEHFTNTRCGICGSRNPGLYTTLAANPNVLHLAVHPSSPYNTCVFNTHNVADNDARTNYYGVYGGTPRIVVQGVVQAAGTNFASSSFLTPFQNQTSPVSIRIKQYKYGADSITAIITIKTVAAHSLGAQRLLVAIAEKTKPYAAPNGENTHYDVFRKALLGATGVSVTLPAVGDSITITARTPINAAWTVAEVYTMAILQTDATKAVTQSEAASPQQNDVLSVATSNRADNLGIKLYPNPAHNQLNITTNDSETSIFNCYTINGSLYYTSLLNQNHTVINTETFPKGVYFINIINKQGVLNSKLIIE